MGDDKIAAAGTRKRCRLSAWTDPQVFMNGKMVDVVINTPTGPVPTQIFQPAAKLTPVPGKPGVTKLDIDVLFKKDALIDSVRGPLRALDDVSLLVTILNDESDGDMRIIWDEITLQSLRSALNQGPKKQTAQNFQNDLDRKEFFQRIIKHCHEVLGVQVLVGFANANAKNSKLESWFLSSTPTPSIDDVTTRIIQFCDDNLAGYDGISFDIEGLHSRSKNPSDLVTATSNATTFYQMLADKLRTDETGAAGAGMDRIVAFAAGPLVSPTVGSRLLQHEDNDIKKRRLEQNGNYVPKSSANVSAFFNSMVHAYEIGKGKPNILVRPMAYDNFDSDSPKEFLDDWHADIVRYAVKEVGLDPGNFQLGIKTIDGPGQRIAIPPRKKPMDGVMKSLSDVKQRCRDLLHPNGVGLALFPTSASFWIGANEALNPTVREAGRTLTHPAQCPLGNIAWQRINSKPQPGP